MPTRKPARMKPMKRRVHFVVLGPDGTQRSYFCDKRAHALGQLDDFRRSAGPTWGRVAKVEIRELTRKRTR